MPTDDRSLGTPSASCSPSLQELIDRRRDRRQLMQGGLGFFISKISDLICCWQLTLRRANFGAF